MSTATEIRLASRPEGVPTHDNFEIVDTEVPAPGDGQILVRNLIMSVDPAMRGRMKDVKSYAPPFQVGEVMSGGAVGEVVESNVDDVKVGDHVLHQAGWKLQATSKRVRDVKATVTELRPGTLVETDANSSMVTTWTVTEAGDRSVVKIETTWDGAGGIGGFFEKTFAPGGLKKIYDGVLEKLAEIV